MSLSGKHILLGVTGSIAAFKAATLARLLVRAGAKVRVVMTPLAKEFITPLTMATLSRNPILVEFFDPENGAWNSHVSLGEWADCYLIAPATANTLAKMACGVADNLLLTTYLSACAPVVVAPAMDLDMYAHAATQRNLTALRADGVLVVEPSEGELASGLTGKGRMAEPEEILTFLAEVLCPPAAGAVGSVPGATGVGAAGVVGVGVGAAGGEKKKSKLSGRKIVVTAGATIEAIDPVRYISNHSSGKMGYAIAEELAARGAEVTLVSGRTALTASPTIRNVSVSSAQEMYDAAVEHFTNADGAVMAAAVADYAPASPAAEKIKKSGGVMTLELHKTKDIAAELGRIKGERLLVGFALETENEQANAEEKLRRKGFDFIVLNSLKDKGAGFGTETNRITILDRFGNVVPYPLAPKSEVARVIVDRMEEFFGQEAEL
ncbi:MAG: bifunctional phosphopantothenoylcysteine decarboxylase/phosphopantothenate synthase [Rikenellaceae bacterium]|jgi:phosphopantothenoylcysteine decarboxylase/phosphopantothenate--cysteine ligase|nr:bifunctional phosphopantothenoylcysteine decarboxylase/phosphopantothenate synthase [Rikenellaceae bacterium]